MGLGFRVSGLGFRVTKGPLRVDIGVVLVVSYGPDIVLIQEPMPISHMGNSDCRSYGDVSNILYLSTLLNPKGVLLLKQHHI